MIAGQIGSEVVLRILIKHNVDYNFTTLKSE